MALGRRSELLCAGLVALGGVSYLMSTPGIATSSGVVSTTSVNAPASAHSFSRSSGNGGFVSSRDLVQSQFMAEGNVRPLSPGAARVALTALSSSSGIEGRDALAAMSVTPTGRIDLGNAGTIEVSVLDDASAGAAYDLFVPERVSNSPVVVEHEDHRPTVAVNYSRSFDSPGEGNQLDVSVTPHAGVSVGPDGSATSAGAEVRIGEYLGSDEEPGASWFVFAGADRRALMYDPSQGMDLREAFDLTQRQVVGDGQAGVALRMGDADISLAYVRREYEYVAGVEKYKETEDFGAVSVNWTW